MGVSRVDGYFNWQVYDRNDVLATLQNQTEDFLGIQNPAEEIHKFFDNTPGVQKVLDKERQMNLLAAIPYPGKKVWYYLWYVYSSDIEGYIFTYLNDERQREITYTYFNFANGKVLLVDVCEAFTTCCEGFVTGHESDIGYPAKAGLLGDIFQECGLNIIDSMGFKKLLDLEMLMYLWGASFHIAKYVEGTDRFLTTVANIKGFLTQDKYIHKDRENFLLMVGRTFGSEWKSIANLIHIQFKMEEERKVKQLENKLPSKIFGCVETEVPKINCVVQETGEEQDPLLEQTLKRVKMKKPLIEDIIYEILVPFGKTKEIYEVNIPHIQIIRVDSESESNDNDFALWTWVSELEDFTSDGYGIIVGNQCYLIDFNYNDIWYTNLSEDKRNEYTKVPVEFNYELIDGLFDLAYAKYKEDEMSSFSLETIIMAIINVLSENNDLIAYERATGTSDEKLNSYIEHVRYKLFNLCALSAHPSNPRI